MTARSHVALIVAAAVALLVSSSCGSTERIDGGRPLAVSTEAPTTPTTPTTLAPQDASPELAGPDVPAPDDTASDDTASDDTAPDDTAPDETAPEQVALPTGIDPVRIEIPAIGVDAHVVDLDLRGPEPEVPTGFADTGWYTQTRLPGEIGPAVIAGHIDSVAGPAVFARLDALSPDDEITVHGAEGQWRTFVVTGAGQYPKVALPEEVFGFDQPVPELRLITCGGTFDRSSGHYRDNYVVYGKLIDAGPEWGS